MTIVDPGANDKGTPNEHPPGGPTFPTPARLPFECLDDLIYGYLFKWLDRDAQALSPFGTTIRVSRCRAVSFIMGTAWRTRCPPQPIRRPRNGHRPSSAATPPTPR